MNSKIRSTGLSVNWRTPTRALAKFSVTTAQSTLPCPHCHSSMRLVRHLDLKGIPEIYLFYCSRCQQVETVSHERAAYTDIPALAAQ
jgi:hypothetical protein